MTHEEVKALVAQEYGIDARTVTTLGRGVINENFLVDSTLGSYVCKRYALRSPEQVAFEHSLLQRLAEKAFPSPRVVPTADGRWQTQHNDRPVALLHYIEGEEFARTTPAVLARVGELVGAMHAALADVSQPVERERWEPDIIARCIKEEHHVVRSRPMPQAEAFVEYVAREYDSIELPDDPPSGITHQDVKPDNIIVAADGEPHFIDFDNAYHGVLVYDMFTTVIWTCFPRGQVDEKLLSAYLRGYASRRPLSLEECEYVFEALRFRLLREAYVWPYRWLDPVKSPETGRALLEAYKNLMAQRESIAALCKNLVR